MALPIQYGMQHTVHLSKNHCIVLCWKVICVHKVTHNVPSPQITSKYHQNYDVIDHSASTPTHMAFTPWGIRIDRHIDGENNYN